MRVKGVCVIITIPTVDFIINCKPFVKKNWRIGNVVRSVILSSIDKNRGKSCILSTPPSLNLGLVEIL